MRAALFCTGLFSIALAGAADNRAAPNVLLITADTLRAGHLSCYGYAWKTSPNIDQLAREGARFESAYSVIPLTGPAHFSLFTSRYPQEHGARRNGEGIASDSPVIALPQLLRAADYHRAAFISAWPLRARLTRLNEWFDHYDEDLTRTYQLFNSSRWAEDVTPRATAWLAKNGSSSKPFFMWVHYFDPHSPYHFRENFADLERNEGRGPVPSGDEETRERIRNYDTEIAYMDWHIGKLLAELDRLDLRDSTIVLLTADHGESLGEHDYVGHGRHLFENIVRVPLVVRYPGKVKAGTVHRTPVSILDITPTLLDLTVKPALDKKTLSATFAGRSLAPALLKESKLSHRRIYYVTFPGKKGIAPKWLSWLWVTNERLPLKFGYLEGRRKHVWSPPEKELAVYDLGRDSSELHPRILETGTPYEAETKKLTAWFERTESRARQQEIAARDLEVLKSLGYNQ